MLRCRISPRFRTPHTQRSPPIWPARRFPALLMVTLALGFLVAPLAADAQPRIAFLGLGTAPPASALPPVVAGFQQGLRELGWVEGQNLTIEWRWAEGSLDRFATLGMDPSFTAAIPFKSSSRTGPRNASIWSVCRCMPRSSILTRAS